MRREAEVGHGIFEHCPADEMNLHVCMCGCDLHILGTNRA